MSNPIKDIFDIESLSKDVAAVTSAKLAAFSMPFSQSTNDQ